MYPPEPTPTPLFSGFGGSAGGTFEWPDHAMANAYTQPSNTMGRGAGTAWFDLLGSNARLNSSWERGGGGTMADLLAVAQNLEDNDERPR